MVGFYKEKNLKWVSLTVISILYYLIKMLIKKYMNLSPVDQIKTVLLLYYLLMLKIILNAVLL